MGVYKPTYNCIISESTFSDADVLLLVGGFKDECYFPCHIWDVILPIDELIFSEG
jgi:hypothetical protein